MNEKRKTATFIAIIALIIWGGVYSAGCSPSQLTHSEEIIELGDVYVDSYRADIYLDGTLAERYDYRIEATGSYRMIYRSWKMPLSSISPDAPYIEPLVVIPTPGAVPYIKDHNGTVRILSANDSQYSDEVERLAERNEVGGYYPQRFPAGRYRMIYLFRIHPYLECDQQFCHWNLMLADEHLPCRQLAIYIHDPDDLMVEFFTHPEMEIQREGDVWAITGSSPKDGLIEVEMLLLPEAKELIEGFPRDVKNVYEKTVSAQNNCSKTPGHSSTTIGQETSFQKLLASICSGMKVAGNE